MLIFPVHAQPNYVHIKIKVINYFYIPGVYVGLIGANTVPVNILAKNTELYSNLFSEENDITSPDDTPRRSSEAASRFAFSNTPSKVIHFPDTPSI